MVEYELGGTRSKLQKRKIQNAHNNHHLKVGYQAQHGEVRVHGHIVGGRTTNIITMVKYDNIEGPRC